MVKSEKTPVKPRVVVADDSKVVRKAATKILGDKFDIILAADGAEAWQILQKDPSVQVVLTDLGMPNLDGYQLIEKIRHAEKEDLRNIPVVVITGAAEEESVKKKVFEIGATDFVGKPFKSTEVIARLEAHANYRRDKVSLQEHVNIDLLTGTLNHKALDEKLEKDVSFINRHKQNIALVMFEIDNFKHIVDKTGHRGSEKIVQKFSKVLSSAIRREDSFGRYNEAKFLTILPMAKTEGVVMLSKRLCDHMKTFKINVAGEVINLTLSIGIAAAPKGCASTPKSLLKTAEQALRNAQKLGPGEVQLLKLENQQADKQPKFISIDDLLNAISNDANSLTQTELTAAVGSLAPLIKLMSKEQKQKLLRG